MKKMVAAFLSILILLSNILVMPSKNMVCASDNQNNEVVTSPITDYYINPLYEGVVTEEDLEQLPPDYCVSTFATNRFTTDESIIVDTFRAAMVERIKQFTIYYETTETMGNDYLSRWIDLAIAETDNPKEGDYLRWHYDGARAGGICTTYPNGKREYILTITFSYYTTAEQETELDIAVNKLISDLEITDSLTDYQKVKKIYDYMCENITYDYTNLNDNSYKLKYTAYAALINKTAVCQGYANLLYYLLNEVGVENRIIVGIGDGGPHTWNIIKLGDVYYCADSTWDAGRSNYDYFLKASKNFDNHTSDEEYTTSDFTEAHPIAEEDYVPTTNDAQDSCGEVTSHTWGGWETIKHPTANDTGLKRKDCTKCDAYEEQIIPELVDVWVQDASGWRYRNADGNYAVSCWKLLGGTWYYFNSSAYMVTGWLNTSGTWYYFNGSGAMTTGWQAIGGIWYYLNGSGAMMTGWQAIGGTWYYFDGSGAMVTGWQAIGGIWYYFNGSGAMVTGWQMVGRTWYYFHSGGAMVANQWVGNYYLQSDGSMATNKWIGRYYVGANGCWIP